ncbi:hypothetical protein JB92DRAFT_2923156 [Gautieria morchelliformis]|nr:hypothetical protein JB92DRAFT_2923156 [Gautieria morchelliformis]
MVKPIDLDEFFKEQEERLNVSDSDWEQYEERVYQAKKRKRTINEEPRSLPLTNEDSYAVENEDRGGGGGFILQNSMHARKKHKVSKSEAASSCLSDVIVPSPRIVTLPNIDRPSSPQHDIAATPSPMTSCKLDPPVLACVPQTYTTPSSSDVTSPIVAPWEDSSKDLPQVNQASGSSSVISVCKSEPATVPPFKSRLKTEEQGRGRSKEAEKQQAGPNHSGIKATSYAKRQADKAKKAQEEQEKLMTPLQYAAILQEKWHTRVSKTSPEKLFLKNKVIYLVFEEQNKSAKDTRIKLDIIARSGGQVATHYDPEVVTHIIPGGRTITLKKTLRALGIRSLSEIPSNIHTVKWDWIVSGLGTGIPDSEIMHESYKQRIAHKYPKREERIDIKGKGKADSLSITNEHSIIEDFTMAHDSQDDGANTTTLHVSSPDASAEAASTSRLQDEPKEDPLLPFYAKARQEAENAESDGESRIHTQTLPENATMSRLKGFQCDKKGIHLQGISPNWNVIEKLAELREMHRDKGTDDDRWRVIGYQKAIGSLKAHPRRIRSREEALKLSGVSGKTADKIMEVIRTGELQRIKYTKTEELKAMRIFCGIYGVGPNTARKWYHQGLKNLDDVRRAVQTGTHKLSMAQEIGLKFYEDINDRMPRMEAEELFSIIKPVALGLDAKLSLDIMGSFRRGKETCGDIDILLTRDTGDGRTHAGILPRLCNLLHKRGILTEDLALPDDWEGLEATYRGLCQKNRESRRRRIDILCVPYESRGAARIYYTGDDIFNRSIRLKANKMDMSLNQRGLFQEVVRDPHDRTKKLCAGSLLCSDSEKKIFEILGVPWQEPHERVRGG